LINQSKDNNENELIINTRRKTNLTNNKLVKINNNLNIDKDPQFQISNENLDSYENKKDQKLNKIDNIPEKGSDLDFENCNVYLKNINPNNNRPYSRKRSAFKYIEDNMEKEREKVLNDNFNSTLSLMRSLNINENSNKNNILNNNFNNNFDSNDFSNKNNMNNQNSNKLIINLKNFNSGGNASSPQMILIKDIDNKIKIGDIEKKGALSFNEKKPEYESRRKKQINFIKGVDSFGNQNQFTNNNLLNFEMQKNNQNNKMNENNNFNASTSNLISGSFESRRIQGSYNKPVIIQAERK